MKNLIALVTSILLVVAVCVGCKTTTNTAKEAKIIHKIDPPERDFFSKVLYFHGVPIKSSAVVSNEALYAAYDRLSLLYSNLLTKQPWVISNQIAAGCEFHVIGRNQVTTDLPEYLRDKHVPLDEYDGLTRDQRTRGMGGRLTSFGEENLLQLPNDRYRGRDICLHESSHSIMNYGCPPDIKARFAEQRQKSLAKELWVNSYAGSNPDEYFAELTMWYFGTHGDTRMTGPKPENGPEGLKNYDPDAYALIDEFWSGRIQVNKAEPRVGRGGAGGGGTNAVANRGQGGTNNFAGRGPRDSLLARAIVAKLTSYKTGETKLTDFYADAGMNDAADNGTNGWYVTNAPAAGTQMAATTDQSFRVSFRNPNPGGRGPAGGAAAATQTTATTNTPAQGTNAAAGQGARRGGGRGGNQNRSLADLEFKSGVLSSFKWNN